MAERIQGLSISLDMETASLDRSMTEIKRSFRTLNSTIKTNSNNLKFGEKSVESYEKGIEDLNEDIEKQRKNLQDTKKHLDEYKRSGQENTVAAQNLAREYNNQADNLNRLEHQLANATKELERMKNEQRYAESNWGKLGGVLDGVGGSLKSVGGRLQETGRTLTRSITLPVAGVTAAVGGMVAAFGWGRLTGIDNARAQLQGMGYDAQEVERISGQVSESIQGGMMTMAEGTSVAAGALAAGVEEGQELEEYIQRVDAAAVGMNRSVDETAMIFNRVQGSGKLMTQELNMVEEAMPGFTQAMADNAGVTLETFREMVTAGEVTSSDFMTVMDDFAGGMADAYAGTFSGMVANTKANIGIIGENLLGGVFEQSKESIEEFLDLLRSDDLREWASEAGEKLGEAFTKIVDNVKGAVQWFMNLDGWQKKLIGSIGGLIVAAGPLLTIGGTFLAVIGNIMTSLAPLTKRIFDAGGIFKFFGGAIKTVASRFSFLLGPVGIAIGVITTLAGVFTYAYKNSGTFRDFIHQLGVKIKEVFTRVVDWVTPGLDAVMEFFDSIRNRITEFWNAEGQQLMQAFQNIGSFISTVATAIWEAIKWTFEQIKWIIADYVMPVVEFVIKTVWDSIQSIISGALDVIMGAVQVFSGLFTGDFSKMWEGIKQIFSGAIDIVWGLIKNTFIGQTITAVIDFSSNFRKNITDLWERVKKNFSDKINEIKKSIKNSFVGDIIRAVTTLKDDFIGIASDMWTGIKEKFDDIVQGAKDLPGRIGDGIGKMASKVETGVKKVANTMLDWLGKGVNGVIGGVNWVLDKFNVSPISEWTVPQYAQGTKGHPKTGPAIVGDGVGSNAGSELVITPDGKQHLSPDKPTLTVLPKGTHVIPARLTKDILNAPRYALGTLKEWGSNAWSGVKNVASNTWSAVKTGAGKVKDAASAVWDYIKEPSKLLDLALETIGVTIPDNSTLFGKIARGGFNVVKDGAIGFIKKKAEEFLESTSAPAGGGAQAWEPVIRKAAVRMGESLTTAELNGIIAQIHRESGGNQGIIQSSAVWDVNMASGNPARGLLQYIPQTFNAYKVPGHGNIYSGYDQLLAFFNNKNWRRDLPYGRSGWGPSGGRKFATGGLINTEGLYQLGEEGAEWVIPTAPNRRTEAMKLLALAGKSIQGNKRPQQLPNVSVAGDSKGEEISLLRKQVQLLTELVLSNRQIADKPVLAEGDIKRAYDKRDSLESINHAIFTGRTGGV